MAAGVKEALADIGPVVYVGVDPHYGLGAEQWLPDYAIVCRHETAVLPLLEAAGVEVFCLQREVGEEALPGRATAGLAHHPKVISFLESRAVDGRLSILLFKPSAQIDDLAEKRGWRILGASARVARPMENKVNFFRLLDEMGLPHPPWREIDLSQTSYAALAAELGQRLVLQGAHGFSGNRTFAVSDEASFATAAAALRQRRARASAFMEGSPMTLNGCVLGEDMVLVNRLFHQVTGAKECTVYPLGACGNDWAAWPVPAEQQRHAEEITTAVGRELGRRGFRGIFGMDFLAQRNQETVVTIEVNPRLVSSVPMASCLEEQMGGVPLLQMHCLATSQGGEVEARKHYQALRGETALRLSGAQMVLHNLCGAPARVRGSLQAGIYTLRSRLVWQRAGFRVSDCHPEDEFLVLPPAPGHLLAEAGECARVQMRRPVLEFPRGLGLELGALSSEARAIAATVYEALQLEPVTEKLAEGSLEE